MPGLSAIILTKNEEKNIGRCLGALQGVVDEVVVIDSFSEDATESICREYGARFFQAEWKGWAEGRNQAGSIATSDFILWLDADEVLSEELQTNLRRLKPDLSGACTFNRRNIYCGQQIRYSGWYPDRKVRIYPKGKAVWEGDFVHELLHVEKGVRISHVDGDLLHYSYNSVEEHWARARHYAALAADGLRAKKARGLFWKMIFSPPARFIRHFLLHRGFLDGRAGLRIAWISTVETYWKYAWARKPKRG